MSRQNRDSALKWGLAFKLAFFVLTATLMIFAAAFAYSYVVSRELVFRNVDQRAHQLVQATVYKIETVLESAEQMPIYLASDLEQHGSVDRARLLSMLRECVATQPHIYGVAAAFEPFAFDPHKKFFAPYYFRRNGAIQFKQIGGEVYNYFIYDWYQIPKELGSEQWSEPYYGQGGKALMTTFSVPFFSTSKSGRKFMGVIAEDIALNTLVKIVSSVSIYRSGYAFLVSRNGVFVAHPDKRLIMRQSIFSMADAQRSPGLRRIGREMILGREGSATFHSLYNGKQCLLYYAPIPASGWSLGVVIPKDELLADVYRLDKTVLIIGLAGFAVLFLIIVFISRTITRPLKSLVGATAEIARGNLDVALPGTNSRDEVGTLTRSVEHMRSALKEYIIDLTETTRAKERIESELKIARTIQMSFLPKKFPPFPEKREFDIYATLESAKEVGGDLYDFFMLDEYHLFFSIGDVSDKGIPAALYMAVTKTLVKGIAEQGIPTDQVLFRVNNELCVDNDSSMFVTFFCSVLDIRTGELSYSCAGHNPPLILHPDGRSSWLKVKPCLVLGGVENIAYQTETAVLSPGDSIVLYTDGFTEAMDGEQVPYGEDRLCKTVESAVGRGAQEVVETMIRDVRRHYGTAPQSDDMAVLVLLYREKTSLNGKSSEYRKPAT